MANFETTVGSTLARRHLATRSNVAHEVVFFRVRSEVLERVRVAEVQRPTRGRSVTRESVVAFGDVLDDAVEHLGRARVVVVPQAPDVVRALEQSGVETAREHLAKRGDTGGAAADHRDRSNRTVRVAARGDVGLVRGNRLVAGSERARLEPRRGGAVRELAPSHDREREHEREGDEKGGEGGERERRGGANEGGERQDNRRNHSQSHTHATRPSERLAQDALVVVVVRDDRVVTARGWRAHR